MQLPDYEQQHVQWDAHRRFHAVVAREYNGLEIIRFTDTDEVVAKAVPHPRPCTRGSRTVLGVEVWATSDDDLYTRWHLHTPDGHEVTRAALTSHTFGQQILWIDVAHQRAVNMHVCGSASVDVKATRPRSAQGYPIYYPAPTAVPTSIGRIPLSWPPEISRAERATIAQVTNACRAWAALLELSITNEAVHTDDAEIRTQLRSEYYAASESSGYLASTGVYIGPEYRTVPATVVLEKGFTDLTLLQRCQLLMGGVTRPRVLEWASHLQVTPRR